jgi:NAD(P)-dependent dehydrogenase (short-subunit alcohol dehydrogenase family)
VSEFAGRVAIVTGASSGIGEATARRLADEGASLVLLASPDDGEQLAQVADELSAVGSRTVAVAADISNAARATDVVLTAMREFGRLDYVVNNAGIIGHNTFFDETIDQFDRMMAVNVRGMYFLATEAAKAMTDGGAMVCTASISSWLGEELQVAYNTSKGAVLMIVRTLGLELAPYGIRVNGVAPGYIRTRISKDRLADRAYWSKSRSRIPLDRPGEPEEVANVIAFLLSDEAAFMYGSIIAVDGGQSAGMRSTDWAAVEQDLAPRPRVSSRSEEDL